MLINQTLFSKSSNMRKIKQLIL